MERWENEHKMSDESRGFEKILEEVLKKGSPDLSSISRTERESVFNWYKKNQLSEKNQVDFMEEFFHYDLIDDATALEFIRPMNSKQKTQLAEFISRAVKPEKYLQSFYECLSEADFYARQRLIKLLSVDPESAIMIAPFENLQKIQSDETKKDLYDGSVSRKNILDSRFGSIEESKKLLDALLKYYEDHPDIQDHIDGLPERSRISHQAHNRFYSAPAINLENIVRYYLSSKAMVLYPYLEKLLDLGFLSSDQAKSLFKDQLQYLPDQTKEEEAEINRLTKKLKGSDDPNFYFYSAYEAVPLKHGFEIEVIRDKGAIRSIENILSNFQEHRKRFEFNHIKFLMDLSSRGAPIFSMVETLGLSKDEVRTVLLRNYNEEGDFFNLRGFGDLKTVLDWNRKPENSEGPNLEKTVTDLLIQQISEGENVGVAAHLRDILPWFEENNKNKIIKVINQRAPQLWLLSLNYAIENKVMPLNELITKSSQKNSYWFLVHFNILLYHASILKKEGQEKSTELEDMKKTARKIILENPYHFLSKDLEYVINQVFTEEEKNSFIYEQLKKQPVDPYFFSQLINKDDNSKYSKICHDVLINNPVLFVDFIDHNVRSVNKILSIKETTDLLVKTTDSLDFDEIFNDNELVLNLLESPQNLERLLNTLRQSNQSYGLIALAKTLNSIQEKKDTNIKIWKSEIEAAKNALKKLTNLQASTSAFDKKDLKLKIDEKRKELSKLEKNKPKERATEQIKNLAKSYHGQLKKDLQKLCESEKFLIFQEDMLDVLDKDAEDLLRKNIKEYLTIHPEVLMREYSRYGDREKHGKLVFREILGEEEFTRLFKSRIRALAFWSGRYGRNIDTDKLPENLLEQTNNTNPLLRLTSEKHLEKDFYESTISVAENFKFYPLYADLLEKMASEEMELYGPCLDLESFQPKTEFVALAKMIFLLENSKVALKNRDAILSLPPKQRGEFVKMIGFLTVYHLDEEIDFDLTDQNYSQVKEKILSHILKFSKKLFEMEDVEIDMVEPININTINALSTYYENSCRNIPIMKKAFHQIMVPVLGGNYNNWRAWESKEAPTDDFARGERLEYLKEKGLLPRNLSLDQYKKWLEDETLDFNETFTYQISDIQSGVKNILNLAIVDNHIEETEINVDGFVLKNNYNEIIQPMKDLVKRQQDYKQKIQAAKKDKTQALTDDEKEEYESIKREIKDYRDEHEDEIKKIEALRYLDRIKKLSIEELELKSILIDQKRIAFSDVFETLEKTFSDKPDFLSDIRRIRELLAEGNKQIFQDGRVSRSQLIITDRVDLETHVFIGEKPVNSCQHYEGSSLNQGLLSYISDSAVKIGQIWDGDGKIIARAIFRLMEDENQNPQLFMERVYSVNTHTKIKEAMIRFAVQKAKSMGIKVYTQEAEYENLTQEGIKSEDVVVLHSRGSRSPYVYTDAGGGKVPNGVFKVEIL